MRYATLALTTTWLSLVPFPALAPTQPGPHAFERGGNLDPRPPSPPPG